jgi:hypothetical protein
MKTQHYQTLDSVEGKISEHITLHVLRPSYLNNLATYSEEYSSHKLEKLPQSEIIRVKMCPLMVEGLNTTPTIFTLTLNFDQSVNEQPIPIIQTNLKLLQFHLWAKETLGNSRSLSELLHVCRIIIQYISQTTSQVNNATQKITTPLVTLTKKNLDYTLFCYEKIKKNISHSYHLNKSINILKYKIRTYIQNEDSQLLHSKKLRQAKQTIMSELCRNLNRDEITITQLLSTLSTQLAKLNTETKKSNKEQCILTNKSGRSESIIQEAINSLTQNESLHIDNTVDSNHKPSTPTTDPQKSKTLIKQKKTQGTRETETFEIINEPIQQNSGRQRSSSSPENELIDNAYRFLGRAESISIDYHEMEFCSTPIDPVFKSS